MLIEHWTGPPADTHTYLVRDIDGGSDAWVIDAPLATAEPVLERVRREGLNVTRLVLTHGHFDHILDAGRYAEEGIPIAAHPAEQPMLDAPQTALFGLDLPMPSVTIAEPLHEGKMLSLGDEKWTVWHAPGHSAGHVMLHSSRRGALLGGDILFHQGYGRLDLPGCDPALMRQTLRRLLELPDTTVVLPGHGPKTTVGAERGWLADLVRTGSL